MTDVSRPLGNGQPWKVRWAGTLRSRKKKPSTSGKPRVSLKRCQSGRVKQAEAQIRLGPVLGREQRGNIGKWARVGFISQTSELPRGSGSYAGQYAVSRGVS